MQIDVSIIIVNYNTINFLLNSINSIFDKSEGFLFEIIVVDNKSTDNSKEIIFNKFGSKVTYISLPQNIGFGKANNEGIKIAKGRNIFLLNPDTILLNNAIKILSDHLDNNPNSGICGGNLFNEDMTPSLSHFKHKQPIFLEVDLLTGGLFSKFLYKRNAHFNYSKDPIEVAMISGADLMIKNSIIINGELFDPDFFMYYEDYELSCRIKNSNYKIINVPSANIVHLTGKSHTLKEKSVTMMLEGRRVFYQKIHSKSYYFTANVIYILAIITRIAYFYVSRNNNEYHNWKLTYNIFLKVNFNR